MPELFRANDTIGTVPLFPVHLAEREDTAVSWRLRWRIRKADGRSRQGCRPVFDVIFQHVDNPPPTPVAANSDAFVKWTRAHLLAAVNLYTAYPQVTARKIRR